MTVGYVLSRYPLLTETFILREMLELERQGQSLRVYALRRTGGRRHPRVATLRAPVWWAPWVGRWRGLNTHARWLRRRPKTYLRTLAAVLWHNRGDLNLWLGAVAYWGKAVAIAERLEGDGVQHLHAHYATHPALVAYVAHRLTGIPYSFTVHAHDLYCHRAMLAEKLHRARTAVCISHFNQRRLERAVPQPRPPIEVIHCGVELASYARPAAVPLEPWGRRPPALRILTVGSLQPYKGHRYLVAACAELRRRGMRVECRIVGGGELETRLRRQISRHGLDSVVRLAGPATEGEVAAALAWADVFALPSVVVRRTGKMEGIPVALMEAMAAGLAVVASRISGIPELVTDGVEGLLVPPADASALAAALANLTPTVRGRLGEAARRKVAAEFELAANVARLRQIFGPAARPVLAEEVAA